MSKIPVNTQNRISKKFQTRLNKLITEEDLDLKEFSKKVNISVPVIRMASLYGFIPSVKVLIKIADYGELSFDYLIGRTDKNDFFGSYVQSDFIARYTILRNEKGVNDSQVANRMPFTRNYISEWKRNKTLPSLDYLIALAEYFNVSIDFLLGRTDIKN